MTTAAFTSSGTWVCPAGITKVDIIMVGGGGGGRTGATGTQFVAGLGGLGGSAGEYKNTNASSLVPGTTYTITVGAGGAANTNGGTTSALGLTASGGATNGYHTDQEGQVGAAGSYAFGGTIATAGADGTGDFHGAGAAAGANYGGGGGGGGGGGMNFAAGGAGGTGGAGYVLITYVVPTATIDSATPESGLAPLEVVFAASATGTPTGYLWTFGDGATSGSQDPTHIYTTVGVKTATFTVYNYYGYAADTITITIYWKPSSFGQVVSADWQRR